MPGDDGNLLIDGAAAGGSVLAHRVTAAGGSPLAYRVTAPCEALPTSRAYFSSAAPA